MIFHYKTKQAFREFLVLPLSSVILHINNNGESGSGDGETLELATL